MLVLWSAPTQRYSLDIDYEYRQDSNLYYLTGVDAGRHDPGAHARQRRRAARSCSSRTGTRRRSTGAAGSLTLDEARARTGIETVLTDEPVRAVRRGDAERPAGRARSTTQEAARFFDALSARSRPARARARSRAAASPIRCRPPLAVRPADSRSVRRLRRPSTRRRFSTICERSRRRTSAGCSSRASRSRARRRWPACARRGPAPTSTR